MDSDSFYPVMYPQLSGNPGGIYYIPGEATPGDYLGNTEFHSCILNPCPYSCPYRPISNNHSRYSWGYACHVCLLNLG